MVGGGRLHRGDPDRPASTATSPARRNLVTDFGKIMDPIADKALTGMAFIGLSIIGELWWWVTIVVLGREWGITAAAVLGDPVRRDGGQPRRQDQDRAAGLRAAAFMIMPLRMFTGAWETVGEVLWWVAAGADGRGGRRHLGDRRRLRPRGDAASAGGSGGERCRL